MVWHGNVLLDFKALNRSKDLYSCATIFSYNIAQE